jgi:putative peptidoglycan lipid II flippase
MAAAVRSHHLRIFRAVVWVALFVALTKGIGAAKEMAIAARYGIGPIVDANVFDFTMIAALLSVWANSLSIAVIPLFAHLQASKPDQWADFLRELLGVTVLVGAAAGLVAVALLPWTVGRFMSEVSAQVVAETARQMAPAMALLLPLGVLGGLFATFLMAVERHANSLLEAVPPLCLLVVLMAFPSDGPGPLVWGTVAGFAAHVLLLAAAQPPALRGLRPRFRATSPVWRTFAAGFGIVILGQAISSGTVVADQIMVAPLGLGANSTLGYASRVLARLTTLGATAVARALLPALSAINVSDASDTARITWRWAQLVFVAGLAVVAFGWPLAPWGIELLFQRGAFTAEDTAVVAELFRYGLLQVPFYLCGSREVHRGAGRPDGRRGAPAGLRRTGEGRSPALFR